MNKRFSQLLALALAVSMVLSFIPAFLPRANALTPPAFWIVPDQSFNTNTAHVGSTFVETLWVSTSGDTFTYQYEVDYNSAQLNCTAAAYTDGATSMFFGGHTTVATGPVLTPGVVSGGETLLGNDVVHATPGGATIITMTFTIMEAPTLSNSPLTSQISLNPANTYLLDPSLATVPGVTLTPANYSFTYAPPTTTPTMDVINLPALNAFGPYTHWVGTTFQGDVAIQTLDGGWFPESATVDLNFNNTLLAVTNVAFDPLWTGPNGYTLTGGDLSMGVSTPSANWTGVVTQNIAVVTFQILTQGTFPPYPFNGYDRSQMILTNMTITSYYPVLQPSLTPIVQTTLYPEVDVYAFITALPPYLSVDGGYMVGPAPSVGSLFNVTVSLNNVNEAAQHLIGVQYRLQYDHSILQPVAVYEGPFFPYWANLEPGSLGTFFYNSIEDPDGIFGPHVLVGHMVFPNATGQWNEPLPNGTGVITIITFKVIYQSFGEPNVFTPLTIADQLAIGLDNLVSQNIVPVTLNPPVNGNVTITTNFPGRMIDLYGGAVNSGLIQLDNQPIPQFTPPYGGQGPNMPMDLVEPQSWVYLDANVTYNYWPVQSKNVAFEVDMPNGTVYTKLSAFTDSNGVAETGFRMPWPCVNPESLFGSDPEASFWKVTATVELADVIINDTMTYHYDYLMHIFKVTTDAFQYNHGDCVGITVNYGSLAAQTYPALLFVQVVDNLGVTVGSAVIQTTIGGAWTQQNTEAYKNFTAFVNIPIPKWAYAGIATIKVDGFNVEPADGGVAITPEYVGPTIAIQPY